MAKTLDDYIKEVTTLAAGRDLSTRWYREKVRDIVPNKPITESNFIRNIRKSDNKTLRPTYGLMNLYYYQPKHEETLPYYDVFPLTIPIKKLKDGFIGINFHYLDIPLRIKLFEKMQPMSAENRKIGWSRVAKIRQIKPCVKRYLASQVASPFQKITEEEMQIAMLMPVQKFYRKGTRIKETIVWRESRRMI